jgi:hypothetical protein
MTDVHKVTIQVRAPRGNFHGEVAEGWYCVVDGYLVMTDAAGKPVDGEKHTLAPGQDARLLACRLVRGRRSRSSPRGWNDRLVYPWLGKI